jgi:hypothetical protein
MACDVTQGTSCPTDHCEVDLPKSLLILMLGICFTISRAQDVSELRKRCNTVRAFVSIRQVSGLLTARPCVCVCVGGRAGTVTRRVPHQILYQLIISETNHPSSKILHWRNFQYCHVSDCSDVTPRTYPPLPYRRYGSATPHDVNTYVTSGKQFSVGYSASPDCEAVQRTLRNATDLLSASHCVKKSAVLPQYISQQVYAYSCVHCRLIQVHYFN